MAIKLDDYILSAESYTVRLMLALLEVPYEVVAVNAYPGDAEAPVLRADGIELRDPGLTLAFLARAYGPSWMADEDASNIAHWLAFAATGMASLRDARRAAIFGGTFDPIHTAHLEMARQAADQFHLDRVLFIPAGNPPHKQTDASFEDRYRMVELACAADPRLVASRLEQGDHKSYSIDTIERVKADSAYGDVFFIIGADAFAEIQTWRRWEDVLRALDFIVVARPGHAIVSPPGARVHRVEAAELPVSSSQIREALARGDMPEALPKAVADYIRTHGLYRSTAESEPSPSGF